MKLKEADNSGLPTKNDIIKAKNAIDTAADTVADIGIKVRMTDDDAIFFQTVKKLNDAKQDLVDYYMSHKEEIK